MINPNTFYITNIQIIFSKHLLGDLHREGDLPIGKRRRRAVLGLAERAQGRVHDGPFRLRVRFDRRGTEPFELFTSEFGQNSVKFQYILLEN